MRLLVDAADRKLIDSKTGLRKALPRYHFIFFTGAWVHDQQKP